MWYKQTEGWKAGNLSGFPSELSPGCFSLNHRNIRAPRGARFLFSWEHEELSCLLQVSVSSVTFLCVNE